MSKNIEAAFQHLEQESFKIWAPEGQWRSYPLAPGFSGAQVNKVDLYRQGQGAQIDNGQYILKLSKRDHWGSEDELKRFNTAKHLVDRKNRNFFSEHVPELIHKFSLTHNGEEFYSMLMRIVGNSFDMHQPVEGPENYLFSCIAESFCKIILDSWSFPEPEAELLHPHEMLEQWLGYRLHKSDAPQLHNFIQEKTYNKMLFPLGVEVLVNPLRFHHVLSTHHGALLKRSFISGLLHGDLHGGNIFVHNAMPAEKPFWVIDFGLSQKGMMGFDQSYLEVALCLYNLEEYDVTLLLSVLKLLDESERGLTPHIHSRGRWLYDCLKKLRNGWLLWQQEKHPTRSDDLHRQLLLSRVAAGLNWANKPISDHNKTLALAYAGWAARHYLESREPILWQEVVKKYEEIRVVAHDLEDQRQLWDLFLGQVDNFSNQEACYIIVSGIQDPDPALKAYGNVPWSAVIDLDPFSDQKGLFHWVEPVIKTRRGVHSFSADPTMESFCNATCWLLTAGWHNKGESPLNYWEWRSTKLRVISRLLERLARYFGPKNMVVVFVPSKSHDPNNPMEWFTDIAAEAYASSGGQGKIILTGHTPFNKSIPNVVPIPIEAATLPHFLSGAMGEAPNTVLYEIPSARGMISISIEQLRILQENLIILHSKLLQEDTESDPEHDKGFWQGRPPSWRELNANIDVERSITDKIINKLIEYISTPPSRTIFLRQKPGMGGTTLLRRIAWNLHRQYPVVIIRNDSDALEKRLQTLHEIVGCPLVIIAESAQLTDARLDELYSACFQKNIRSVFLYLRKDFSNGENDSGSMDEPSYLPDPMNEKEAEKFLNRFKRFTDNKLRLKELGKITHQPDYMRYRIPFFYGLITFERNFNGVDQFVKQHLGYLDPRVSRLMQYLSVVTRFSNFGLPRTFISSFILRRSELLIPMKEIIPPGPYRLMLIYENSVRLLHPLIAEQVLEILIPGDTEFEWERHLYNISMDLISDLYEIYTTLDDKLNLLLSGLFINRQGGYILPIKVEDVSVCSPSSTSGDIESNEQPETEEPKHNLPDYADEREEFSPIIMKMLAVHNTHGRQVFDHLVDKFPNEAHFWNHRGRYYMYRLNDFAEAEKSLLRALDISERKDYVHFHTYGMVKRRQVRQQLWQLKGTMSAQEVFDSVADNYLEAENAFKQARKINRENAYAFISHIQMIFDVIKNVLQRTGAKSILDEKPEIQSIIMDRVGQINDMVDSIQQIFLSSPREKSYIDQFESDLKALYGNLEGVVNLWEIVTARGSVSHFSKRALVKAYLARKDDQWIRLEHAELRRIKDMMEENLSGTHWRENDSLWWFQAVHRLPEVDTNSLIAKLNTWSAKALWPVHFFLYMLHFIAWIEGDDDAETEVKAAMEQCRKLVYGRKRLCRYWFGFGTGTDLLVDATDLEWDQKDRWFVDVKKLRPLNGLIEENFPDDDSPPHVVIEGKFKVPFYNDGTYKKYQDENKQVHFFMGFSPMGLRAFKVTPGFVSGGSRLNFDHVLSEKARGIDETQADPEWIKQHMITLTLDKIGNLATDLVTARNQWGAQVTLTELEKLIEAILGISNLSKMLRVSNFEEILRKLRLFTFQLEKATEI